MTNFFGHRRHLCLVKIRSHWVILKKKFQTLRNYETRKSFHKRRNTFYQLLKNFQKISSVFRFINFRSQQNCCQLTKINWNFKQNLLPSPKNSLLKIQLKQISTKPRHNILINLHPPFDHMLSINQLTSSKCRNASK